MKIKKKLLGWEIGPIKWNGEKYEVILDNTMNYITDGLSPTFAYVRKNKKNLFCTEVTQCHIDDEHNLLLPDIDSETVSQYAKNIIEQIFIEYKEQLEKEKAENERIHKTKEWDGTIEV